ncbi:hypothetical protein B0I35DRAFT_422190 [Stachybotrys elegans]|uniref:Uncharacterized protein n=1 Tax=Stachybotrys elegans TaxID=80388 RepID=A0A8K0SYT5_9HYPO|nr:hypothetical protein B0I35DRAFT_422190 [Stachybotrys elegans]
MSRCTASSDPSGCPDCPGGCLRGKPQHSRIGAGRGDGYKWISAGQKSCKRAGSLRYSEASRHCFPHCVLCWFVGHWRHMHA